MKVCCSSFGLSISFLIPLIIMGWVSVIIHGFHVHRGLPSVHRSRRPFDWSRGTRLPKTMAQPIVDFQVDGNSTNTISSYLDSSHEISEPRSVNINHWEHDQVQPNKIDAEFEGSRKHFITNEKDWMQAEISFYRDSHHTYVPRITNEKETSIPLEHLEAAAKEFARRFPYRSVEEEQKRNIEMSSGSPALLVANNVKDDWHVPCKFQNEHAVRFMVVPGATKDTSTLFITSMAGLQHGLFHSLIHKEILMWISSQRIDGAIWSITSGGKLYQPDLAFGPNSPDLLNKRADNDIVEQVGNHPYARLVVELEYAHRDARALRQAGFKAMANPYSRLFFAVKIWKTGAGGNFGGAAVLWSKGDDNVIAFRKAIDFGTKQLESRSKQLFEEPGNAEILPPVTKWTRPQPRPGFDSLRSELNSYLQYDSWNDIEGLPMNDDWWIILPAGDVLYKSSTKRSTIDMPYIMDWRLDIEDCKIDLQSCIWRATNGNFF